MTIRKFIAISATSALGWAALGMFLIAFGG